MCDSIARKKNIFVYYFIVVKGFINLLVQCHIFDLDLHLFSYNFFALNLKMQVHLLSSEKKIQNLRTILVAQ